jgi:carboxypeptidase C (cathepsin A)
VAPDAFFFSGDNGVGFVYNLTEPNLSDFYRDTALNTDYRVLIYNGDTDPGLNSFIMQNWTRALGLKELEAWRPWTLDGRSFMGGYVTRYEGNFDTLTIRGSGHMVPEFKPRAALEFLTRWLKTEEWQGYNPKASRVVRDGL